MQVLQDQKFAESNEYRVPQGWRELPKDMKSLRHQMVQEDSLAEEDDNAL